MAWLGSAGEPESGPAESLLHSFLLPLRMPPLVH